MVDLLFCPSLKAVNLWTSSGTVTCSSSQMESRVCINLILICVIETTRDQFLHIVAWVFENKLVSVSWEKLNCVSLKVAPFSHQRQGVILILISTVLSFRAAAMGQTCGQLWGPVFLHHQWGNSVHVPHQPGSSAIPSHQHWHPETRAAALGDNHSTAWQGRDGWEHTPFIQRMQRISAQLLKNCLPTPQKFRQAYESSSITMTTTLDIHKLPTHGFTVPQLGVCRLAKTR